MFKKKKLKELRNDWGFEIKKKRNTTKTKEFFKNLVEHYKPKYSVDDQTFKDIDFDNIFKNSIEPTLLLGSIFSLHSKNT